MARTITATDHTAGDDAATRKLLIVPTCPCGSGPVDRFVLVNGETALGCSDCYRACHTAPEVTHHVRTSHAGCEHESTPAMRGRCRAARLRGVAGPEARGRHPWSA